MDVAPQFVHNEMRFFGQHEQLPVYFGGTATYFGQVTRSRRYFSFGFHQIKNNPRQTGSQVKQIVSISLFQMQLEDE